MQRRLLQHSRLVFHREPVVLLKQLLFHLRRWAGLPELEVHLQRPRPRDQHHQHPKEPDQPLSGTLLATARTFPHQHSLSMKYSVLKCSV